MRAVTHVAMVEAVGVFVALWEAERPTEEAEWAAVAVQMAEAFGLYMEDVVRAAGGPLDGACYNPARDDRRLKPQLGRIFDVMADGGWHTLVEIQAETGYPPASISAQLRHLRKERHGSWVVDTAHRGGGVYIYRMRNPGGSALPPILPVAFQPSTAQPAAAPGE